MGQRRSSRGPGRIWTIRSGQDTVVVSGVILPAPGIGEPGDYAHDAISGALWGPKSANVTAVSGMTVTSPWPLNPSYIRSPNNNVGGALLSQMTAGNGVVRTRIPNASPSVEGTAFPTGYMHSVSANNTWNATAGGWRARGFMYLQMGDAFSGSYFAKGGSVYGRLKRRPDAGFLLEMSVGNQYGSFLPGIQIDSAGLVKWFGAAHSNGTTIATANVNDDLYMSGVNGKYDFQLVRSGALIASSTNFYAALDDYTLGGLMGFGSAGTNPSDAQAGCVSDICVIAGI